MRVYKGYIGVYKGIHGYIGLIIIYTINTLYLNTE